MSAADGLVPIEDAHKVLCAERSAAPAPWRAAAASSSVAHPSLLRPGLRSWSTSKPERTCIGAGAASTPSLQSRPPHSLAYFFDRKTLLRPHPPRVPYPFGITPSPLSCGRSKSQPFCDGSHQVRPPPLLHAHRRQPFAVRRALRSDLCASLQKRRRSSCGCKRHLLKLLHAHLSFIAHLNTRSPPSLPPTFIQLPLQANQKP